MAAGKRRAPLNLATNLVLVLPLLVFYEIGVLFGHSMNGADLITLALLELVGLKGFLITQAVLLFAALGAIAYIRRKQRVELTAVVGPVFLESSIYALTMGTLIVFVMIDVLKIDPRIAIGVPLLAQAEGSASPGLLNNLVIAAGAGVYEELVFRLLLITALTALLEHALKLRRALSIGGAILVSSLLFSAAHHLGPAGEAWHWGPFVYRTIAGLFFSALFQWRSFAVAVYTHTFYDVYVLLLH